MQASHVAEPRSLAPFFIHEKLDVQKLTRFPRFRMLQKMHGKQPIYLYMHSSIPSRRFPTMRFLQANKTSFLAAKTALRHSDLTSLQ